MPGAMSAQGDVGGVDGIELDVVVVDDDAGTVVVVVVEVDGCTVVGGGGEIGLLRASTSLP